MTPKNEAPAKTHEEMLRAIIEAQVRGGCIHFDHLLDRYWELNREWDCVTWENNNHQDILPILLDTEGCKAAYGEEQELTMWKTLNCEQLWVPRWKKVVEDIAWTWHSGPGNNINAAIKTAFDLLPHSR